MAKRSQLPVFVIFFLSGYAALTYQVVWNRALTSIIGINIESVTLVVTAFMLGLGLGSLLGGQLSKRPGLPTLLVFGAAEVGVGLFGLLSLPLFAAMGELTLALSPAATAALTFFTLLPPTLLMGATLPLLSAHLIRRDESVGGSVGALYFVNTAGSALAALVAVAFVLGRFGLHRSVELAACISIFIGAWVTVLHLRSRGAQGA